MATTISDNYQIKYSEKWGSYLPQEASRLEKYVTVETGLSGRMVASDPYGLRAPRAFPAALLEGRRLR